MSTSYSIYDGPEGPLLLALDDDDHLYVCTSRIARCRSRRDGCATTLRSPAGPRSSTSTSPGTRTAFDLPLRLHGTPFQVEVWEQLRAIPYGETISYGELAKRVDRPEAARAVGAANGQNPIAIVVPCHRVIGADGSLTGFGGGLPWKRWLLAREQPQGSLLGT